MGTKKVSGTGLATDIRAGMDCVALTEKYDLSVAQLRKAVDAIVARGILPKGELPSWFAEEKPWKCPKCGRSQSERFPRCPVCEVIISKLMNIESGETALQQSGTFSTLAYDSSFWDEEEPKSRFAVKAIVASIGAVALLVLVVALMRPKSPSEQPTQPTAPQVQTSKDEAAPVETGASSPDVAYGGVDKPPSIDALLRNTKAQRIARLAHAYQKTHTYTLQDEFACVDMSVDLWNQIETAGIRAGLMAGNIQTDITGLRPVNIVHYVSQMNHAWVVAEIEPGRWIPVESTAGVIVSPLDLKYSRYFSGEFFTNPREFKRFEELRRNFFKVCWEAVGMEKSLRETVRVQPYNRQALLEAYRTRGKLDQRAHDCLNHLKEMQQTLEGRAAKVTPWTIQ
jgi:hypothetical protein